IFNEMLSKIEKIGEVSVIVWKLDRLARNPVDEGKLKWLLQKGTIAKIATPDRVYYPNDNVLITAVEFGMANQYIRDLSTNVKRGLRTKLEKGGWPNQAPIGYKNDRLTKTIVIDTTKARYIQKAFEIYSTGGYSLKEISNIVYAEGLRTASGMKVRRGHFHAMFNNPFYHGMMLRQGVLYKGNHEPLITKNLFDRVSDVLSGKVHSKKQKHFFHLRGFAFCASCGCMLTATKKKGHDYYYCTNGKGICDQHKGYLRSEALDEIVGGVFKDIQFDEELIEITYAAAKEKLEMQNGYTSSAQETQEIALKTLHEKQSRLLDSYLAGTTPTALYESKLKELTNEQAVIENQLQNNSDPDRDKITLELVKNVFLDSNRAQKEYLEATNEQKRKVVENLLWNLRIENKKASSFQLKMPYQALVQVGQKRDFATMLCVVVWYHLSPGR
ncbi:MAG: resolvase protein, partial [uncultured bacterium]